MTRGYNMIFGSISKTILDRLGWNIIDALISNCTPKGMNNDDADTRWYAIRSLKSIIQTIGIQNLDPALVNKALGKFFESLNDYAVDKWGDVGSWVRE